MTAGSKGKVFGVSVERVEDRPLLRGEARFVDDIAPPGLLHIAFVRSPHAHARINGIDKTAALAMPGVHAVLAIEDLSGQLADPLIRTALPSPSFQESRHRPVLAQGEALYVGEPVAAVIADSRYLAEDAAALVEVDYEVLDAVGDCRAALEPSAPRYHSEAKHNTAARFKMDYGDTAAAFAKAAHVFKRTCSMHRGVAQSMECRGAVASYDPVDDRTTLWSSTQTPHANRRLLCEMLGLDDDKIRVVTPEIGGGFGPKLVFYGEEVVAVIATRMLQRPVKWIEDRREHFISTTQERDEIWEMEIAVDGQARILGLRGRLIHDNGAYMVRGVNVPYGAGSTITLAYVVPAFDLDIVAVATNKVPVTPIRGAGKPQGVFVMERLLDTIAREMKIDRAEVRRRNIVRRDMIPYATPMKTRGGMQITLDAGDYPACLAKALDAAGWSGFAERQAAARRQGRYIGLGLANYVEGTGRGPYESVSVRIGDNGRIHVASGASAIGQGTKTMLAQIVAEQLGADMSNVVVTTGDTNAIAHGIGTFNSRHAAIAGPSAHAAALKVREKTLLVASHMLGVGVQALEIDGRHVKLRGDENKKLSLAEVARAVVGLPGYYMPGGVNPGLEASETVIINDMTYANGTGIVEIEVDIETGQVAVERVVMVHDCGTIIHPQIVAGQIVGGLAHGLGNALYERMTFDDNAQPVSTTLGEYLLVTSTEMPKKVELLEASTKTPLNALGVKGVGETGVLPMAGAIASGIEDALAPFGVVIDSAPISPQELLNKIAAGRGERAA